MCFEVLVEQDVRGLDIPVDYARVAVMVKIGQPLCSTNCDPQSCVPIKLYFL
jgi:hypothetical protein